MRFRYQLFWTFIIQGAGAFSVFIGVSLLAYYLGSSSQGVFSKIKADSDFISNVAFFGLPQALFYFLSLKKINVRTVLNYCMVASTLAFFIGVLYSNYYLKLDIKGVIVFSAVVSVMVMAGILRTTVLAVLNTVEFNISTAIPQISTLIFILLIIYYEIDMSINVILIGFVFSYSVAVVYSFSRIVRNCGEFYEEVEGEVGVRKILSYGAASGATAILASGTMVFWFYQVEQQLGLSALGVFSMALLIIQAIITPINYTVPLLFKRWTGSNIGGGEYYQVSYIWGYNVCAVSVNAIIYSKY